MPINLVIPVSQHDLHLLPIFTRLCIKLGGFSRHPVFFVPTKEVSGKIGDAVEAFRSIAASVTVLPLELTPEGGWPDACNRHFVETVYALARTGNMNWWYFCELDSTFTRSNPLDLLETERNISGAVLMGAQVHTRQIDPKTKEFVTFDWDTHIVGSGIYPPMFFKTVHWLRQLGVGIAFDVQIRHEVRKLVRNSAQFQHMWGTVNYRVEEGEVRCDPHPDNPPGTDHSGVVRRDATVVHGCKDGSLAQLILNGEFSFTEEAVKPPVVNIVKPEVVQGPGKNIGAVPLDSGLVHFDAGMGTPELRISSETEPVVQLPTDPADFSLGDEPEIEEPEVTTEDVPTTDPTPNIDSLLDRAKELFSSGNKRVSSMAEALGTDKTELKTLLTKNGYEVSAQGWVKEAA